MQSLFFKMSQVFCIILLISNCASVNKGLDTANEGAEEVGKPIGKVINLPSSVSKGAAEGILHKGDEENPFNR